MARNRVNESFCLNRRFLFELLGSIAFTWGLMWKEDLLTIASTRQRSCLSHAPCRLFLQLIFAVPEEMHGVTKGSMSALTNGDDGFDGFVCSKEAHSWARLIASRFQAGFLDENAFSGNGYPHG